MLKKVLVANRGEIAVRIMRACREMGIRTVAVYSEADKDSLHRKLADESVCIGPARSGLSYLNVKNLIEAACQTGADSIHPGYGFLSESSSFAKMCNEIGIKFIGPSSEIIELMGNKSKAKATMKKAGVPVVPGSDGLVNSLEEAKISFNDDSIYIEKFVENPRHVEVQILADEHGNVVHLGERDCSIQRRNQKVLEETPSMILNDKTRKKMFDVTVKAVKEIGYSSAGTIEYLVDKNLDFYFMEMNTRVQVEHPITEAVSGVDIVKEQLRIAAGETLSISQKDIHFTGHSMECRINAEDPEKNFMPCPGLITGLLIPGGNGIRVDTAVYAGYRVPQTYDSMIGKLIVHGKDRAEAIAKMKSALGEFIVEGINTNTDFLYKILDNENFKTNNYDTSFIKREFGDGFKK